MLEDKFIHLVDKATINVENEKNMNKNYSFPSKYTIFNNTTEKDKHSIWSKQ